MVEKKNAMHFHAVDLDAKNDLAYCCFANCMQFDVFFFRRNHVLRSGQERLQLKEEKNQNTVSLLSFSLEGPEVAKVKLMILELSRREQADVSLVVD